VGLCLRSRVVPGIDCSPLPGPRHISALPNKPLMDQDAACGGANETPVLPFPQGRLRLLHAAWRPCSRGPPLRRAEALVLDGSESATRRAGSVKARRCGGSCRTVLIRLCCVARSRDVLTEGAVRCRRSRPNWQGPSSSSE
jgi:hypothetical protein